MRRKSRQGLFYRLVGSRFFQLLIGNSGHSSADGAGKSENKNRKSGSKQSRNKGGHQSLISQAVDLILFAILCLFAPLIFLVRKLSDYIGDRYWVKFSLGVITGLSSLAAVFLILRLIFY